MSDDYWNELVEIRAQVSRREALRLSEAAKKRGWSRNKYVGVAAFMYMTADPDVNDHPEIDDEPAHTPLYILHDAEPAEPVRLNIKVRELDRSPRVLRLRIWGSDNGEEA